MMIMSLPGLTKDAIRSIPIPVPSIEKQNEIADHINELRNKAKHLKKEAHQEIENARQQVEEKILEN